MHDSLEALACPENFSSFDLPKDIQQEVFTCPPLFSFVKTDFVSFENDSKAKPDETNDEKPTQTDTHEDLSEFLFKPSPIAWGFRAQIEVIDVARDPAIQIQAAIASAQAQAIQAAQQQQQATAAFQLQQQLVQQQLQQQAALQQQLLQQQRQQQQQNAINSFTLDPAKTVTPPPPGLFTQQSSQNQSQQQFNHSPLVNNTFIQNSNNGATSSPAIGNAAALQNFQNMQMFQQQMGMQQAQSAPSPSQANSGELLARLMGKGHQRVA